MDEGSPLQHTRSPRTFPRPSGTVSQEHTPVGAMVNPWQGADLDGRSRRSIVLHQWTVWTWFLTCIGFAIEVTVVLAIPCPGSRIESPLRLLCTTGDRRVKALGITNLPDLIFQSHFNSCSSCHPSYLLGFLRIRGDSSNVHCCQSLISTTADTAAPLCLPPRRVSTRSLV